MVNLPELVNKVHDYGLKEGWWDKSTPADDIVALIHSDWSDVLEAHWGDKPMDMIVRKLMIGLFDLLDAAGEWHVEFTASSKQDEDWLENVNHWSVERLVVYLHHLTSLLWCDLENESRTTEEVGCDILGILITICNWVQQQGMNPEEYMDKTFEDYFRTGGDKA